MKLVTTTRHESEIERMINPNAVTAIDYQKTKKGYNRYFFI